MIWRILYTLLWDDACGAKGSLPNMNLIERRGCLVPPEENLPRPVCRPNLGELCSKPEQTGFPGCNPDDAYWRDGMWKSMREVYPLGLARGSLLPGVVHDCFVSADETLNSWRYRSRATYPWARRSMGHDMVSCPVYMGPRSSPRSWGVEGLEGSYCAGISVQPSEILVLPAILWLGLGHTTHSPW